MMDLGLVNDKELVDLAVAAMKVAEDAKGRMAAMWPCRSRRR